MTDKRTIDVYDARADEYAGVVVPDGEDDTLNAFIAALSKNSRVLDLGCGVGNSAAQMQRAGMEVVALDPSEAMAAKARELHGVDVLNGSFDELPGLGTFSGIWANFCLLHATRADMPRHLTDIYAALVPGGLFHIALKLGEGDARDRLDRFYTYYTEPELKGLLLAAGFCIVDTEYGEGLGLEGSVSKWIAIRARAKTDA